MGMMPIPAPGRSINPGTPNSFVSNFNPILSYALSSSASIILDSMVPHSVSFVALLGQLECHGLPLCNHNTQAIILADENHISPPSKGYVGTVGGV